MTNEASEKCCTTCLVTKKVTEFYSKGKRTDSICKSCIKKKRKTKYVTIQKASDFNRILNLFDLIFECENSALTKLENDIDKILITYNYKTVA